MTPRAQMTRIIHGSLIAALALATTIGSRRASPRTDVGELKITIKEWDVPTKGAHPHDPAVGMDGALWFTEQMQNKIGRVDPSTGAFKEFPLKVDNSGPHGLVADSEDNIWFTGNFKAYIGKLDAKTGEIKEYKMPDKKAEDPHSLVFDADGTLWFTVQVGNFVGRLDPRSGKIDLQTVPTSNAHPYGIQVNSQGIPFFCDAYQHGETTDIVTYLAHLEGLGIVKRLRKPRLTSPPPTGHTP